MKWIDYLTLKSLNKNSKKINGDVGWSWEYDVH